MAEVEVYQPLQEVVVEQQLFFLILLRVTLQ